MDSFKIRLESTEDASDFNKMVMHYECDVDFKVGHFQVDAKSLLGIIDLGIGKDAIVTLISDDKAVTEKFTNDIKRWRND